MLEIWLRPLSSNVIPVIWTAAKLGLDIRLNLAGGSFGVLGIEECKKINPNRLIPTIRDDGFVLWECHAIIRYLAYRYFNVAVERPTPPSMEARYARLSERPAYKKHVMRFFGTNPTEWKELERRSSKEWGR